MNKEFWRVLLFGITLALLVAALKYFEYSYFIKNVDTATYTSIIAIIFTVIGLTLGNNLFKSSQAHKSNNLNAINQVNLSKLNLNKREYEMLQFIKKGLTNQEIADQLFIALPTVKTHISKLYSKLEVNNRTKAILKAQELGVL